PNCWTQRSYFSLKIRRLSKNSLSGISLTRSYWPTAPDQARLARKNHAKTEATSSLRARKAQHHILADSSFVHCQAAKGYGAGHVLKLPSAKSSGIFRRSRRVPLPQPASFTNL